MATMVDVYGVETTAKLMKIVQNIIQLLPSSSLTVMIWIVQANQADGEVMRVPVAKILKVRPGDNVAMSSKLLSTP